MLMKFYKWNLIQLKGNLTLYFKEKWGEDIKTILKRYAKMGGNDEERGIDLTNLKSMND